MKCIYCDHPYTYLLKDNQRKCGKCKRKFSPQKLAREQKLRSLFIEGYNARETSKKTGMHFATILKYYENFRISIALHADTQYQLHTKNITGYDEYLYLPKSLKIEDNIDKLKHFLTLSYDNKVYNLMMPSLQRFNLDKNDTQEQKLLLKYLRFNKIAKLSKAQNTITQFWEFFEEFILQYKGVSDEQFIFYLKEAEWRFNYSRSELIRSLELS
ncbi:transposase [Sulfurovum mangrovi]|uniref:transposase n=1 Tax=Sulfurovum mangrovi TaxID=2893889 RepID=UPI001E300A63|nr:transposase [Sulfurovum mangrovi]UFH59630.1 transposase [Sulfurovum mangrovi]UFH60771.1 transposase [Sulfurovum mangrovi]